MQVTVDIPEALYGVLDSFASAGRTSVSDLLIEGAIQVVRSETGRHDRGRVELPLIIGQSGPLMHEGINLNEVAFMSDDEIDELLAGY